MLREAFFRVVETAEFAAEMQERTAGPAGAGLNFPDKDRMIAAREAFIELARRFPGIGRHGVREPSLFSIYLHPIERLLPPPKWEEMKFERQRLRNGIAPSNSRNNDVSRIFVGKHMGGYRPIGAALPETGQCHT